jgi:hypothetical protein
MISIISNVTNLTLSREKITDKCLFPFPNVTTLKLVMLIEESNDLSVQTFHIESLKRMSNRLFQNIKNEIKDIFTNTY